MHQYQSSNSAAGQTVNNVGRRMRLPCFPQDAPSITAAAPQSGFVLEEDVLKHDGIMSPTFFLGVTCTTFPPAFPLAFASLVHDLRIPG